MTSKTRNEFEKKDGLDFHQLFLQYIGYWPWFLLLSVLSFAGAWLYLYYATPIYSASAGIMIKDETKGSEDSKAIQFLSLTSTKKLIENETEVISSKSLINTVVNELGLYAPIFVKGKLHPVSAYNKCPVRIELKQPEDLHETADVYFDYNREKKLVNSNGATYKLGQWYFINGDVLRFVTNENFDGSLSEKYFYSLVHPGTISWEIKDNFEVTPTSKVSTILRLLLKDEVPDRARDILNGLISNYNKATLIDKNTLAKNTLLFVEERLKHVEHELDSVESAIKYYKASTGSIDISTQGQLFLQNVSANDQKLSDINMQFAVLDQVQNYVVAKENKSSIVPSTLGVNDPTLSNLLNLLYNTELEYEKLKNKEGENSTVLISLRNQIQKIRPSILENINNQRGSLTATKNNVLSTNRSYSGVIRSIPEKEKELIDINRRRSIVSGIYTFLLEKREDLVLSYSASIPNTTIIDEAEATAYPVSPKRKQIYLFAFAVPFIIGIGSISLKEIFNSKIQYRHEIEEFTTRPVIGEISHNKTKNSILAGRNERSLISAQFRQLRVALTLNKERNNYKRILVTSSIEGEGKSLIALNLALTFALTGKRIAIVELDINNPNISNKLNIKSEFGIADFLEGKCEVNQLLHPYEKHENLCVIPSGKQEENIFSELLENGRINQLMNYLEANFDYIIIDTAPANAITDAYVLSSRCDVTLYVIRHNHTPRIFIERLDQGQQLKNIMIVFNDIRQSGFGKYHFGFGYGYGYAYHEKKKKQIANA
jgi:tyrosine-protein kinase Etk/Wzc